MQAQTRLPGYQQLAKCRFKSPVHRSKPCSLKLLCRLVNRSGPRLSYWVDGLRGRSNVIYINSWEEGPLQVEPLEKTVALTNTQLQVRSRVPRSLMSAHGCNVHDMLISACLWMHHSSTHAHTQLLPSSMSTKHVQPCWPPCV